MDLYEARLTGLDTVWHSDFLKSATRQEDINDTGHAA